MPCVTSASECVSLVLACCQMESAVEQAYKQWHIVKPGGSSSGRRPFQYLTAIFTRRMLMRAPSRTCDPDNQHATTDLETAEVTQNDSCHRVPITPTQQGIKDKQTCSHRKRRWNDVCYCGSCGVSSFFYSEWEDRAVLFFKMSCHAPPVQRCCTGKQPQWFRSQNQFVLLQPVLFQIWFQDAFVLDTVVLHWCAIASCMSTCTRPQFPHYWVEMWTILGRRYWSARLLHSYGGYIYVQQLPKSSFWVRIWHGVALCFTWTVHIWCPHRSSKPVPGPWISLSVCQVSHLKFL